MTYAGIDVDAAYELAGATASKVCRRVPGSSWPDLRQEGVLWMLTHPHKLEEWFEEEDQGYAKTFRSVYNCQLDFAQRDKAERTGYRPEDNFYYSIGMLKRMLPLFYADRVAELQGEYDQLNLPDRDAYVDIELGLKKLSLEVRQKVFAWFDGDRDLDEVAWEIEQANGITYDAARKRVERVVGKLQAAIGGPAPRAVVEGRRAVSNAAARAVTDNAYSPEGGGVGG